MSGMGKASLRDTEFTRLYSTQKRKVPSFFLTRQTGDAQGESEGSITPDSSISSKMSSSASRAESEGRRGDCLIGKVSPVSM